jgi:hypothetical protein
LRVGDEVVVPVGVLGAAAGGAYDEYAAGRVGVVAEDRRVGSAGAGAGGGEQEQAGSFEGAADLAGVGAELLDELLREIVQGSLLPAKWQGEMPAGWCGMKCPPTGRTAGKAELR